MNNFKVFFLIVILFSVSACKNDGSKSIVDTKELDSGNDVKGLEAVGSKDLSAALKYDQSQFIPEVSCGFHFKSQRAMKMYLRNFDQNTVVNFDKDDVFVIIVDSAEVKTNFTLNGIDLNGNPSLISVITKPSEKAMNKHRPSFVISVPKTKIQGLPIFKLNGEEIQVTSID